MTLSEWLKSRLKTDTIPQQLRKPTTHYTPLFITPRKKGFATRACRKTANFRFRIETAAPSVQERDKHHQQQLLFDTDSFVIGIDNHASRCISNDIRHFVTPITPTRGVKHRVKALGKHMLNVKGEGTVLWKWEDDDGRVHSHYIDGALYVPDADLCLLSPQHWAQQAKDNHPKPYGTWCATLEDKDILYWKQNQYKRTVPMNPSTNTGRFRSAGGSLKYQLYAAVQDAYNGVEEQEHVVYQADVHIIPPDDEDAPPDDEEATTSTDVKEAPTHSDEVREENLTDFMTEPPLEAPANIVEDDEENLTALSPQADLLRWHYRLGHLSFRRLKLLAMLGILPRRLATVQHPKCAGCLYGALTRRPWRTKGQRGKLHAATTPGQCISVDQLESSMPGFIALMKGHPTKRCYCLCGSL